MEMVRFARASSWRWALALGGVTLAAAAFRQRPGARVAAQLGGGALLLYRGLAGRWPWEAEAAAAGLARWLRRSGPSLGAGVSAGTRDDATVAAKVRREAAGERHHAVDEASEDSFPAGDPPGSGRYT